MGFLRRRRRSVFRVGLPAERVWRELQRAASRSGVGVLEEGGTRVLEACRAHAPPWEIPDIAGLSVDIEEPSSSSETGTSISRVEITPVRLHRGDTATMILADVALTGGLLTLAHAFATLKRSRRRRRDHMRLMNLVARVLLPHEVGQRPLRHA